MENLAIIMVQDETATGTVLNQMEMTLPAANLTLKELIALRVLKEVEVYNKKQPKHFQGLVQPTEAERTLNGFKLKPKTLIDGEKQVYIALEAFTKNSFFVLVNDKQMESLDEVISVAEITTVSFVKLTPLVGG
jgi:hypothetical protein